MKAKDRSQTRRYFTVTVRSGGVSPPTSPMYRLDTTRTGRGPRPRPVPTLCSSLLTRTGVSNVGFSSTPVDRGRKPTPTSGPRPSPVTSRESGVGRGDRSYRTSAGPGLPSPTPSFLATTHPSDPPVPTRRTGSTTLPGPPATPDPPRHVVSLKPSKGPRTTGRTTRKGDVGSGCGRPPRPDHPDLRRSVSGPPPTPKGLHDLWGVKGQRRGLRTLTPRRRVLLSGVTRVGSHSPHAPISPEVTRDPDGRCVPPGLQSGLPQ